MAAGSGPGHSLMTIGVGDGGGVTVGVGAVIGVPPAAVGIVMGAPPAPGGWYMPESSVISGGGDPGPPTTPVPFAPRPFTPGGLPATLLAPPADDDQGPILLPVDAEQETMNAAAVATRATAVDRARVVRYEQTRAFIATILSITPIAHAVYRTTSSL